MQISSIHEIKQELANATPQQLTGLCLRLARFKQENKALLSYLLFQAGDEADYIEGIKQEIAEQFTTINTSTPYFIKKSLRKIIRIINRHATYSGIKTTETELRIYFCQQFIQAGMHLYKSKVLQSIYDAQVRKIKTVVKGLHEDLRHDYLRMLDEY